MIPRLLTRLGIEFVIVADVILIGLLYAGVSRFLSLTAALLLGQAVMIARIGLALSTNPVNRSFLDAYTSSPAQISAIADLPGDHAVEEGVAEFFRAHNMASDGVVEVSTGEGTSWSQAFVSPDGFVLGAATVGSTKPMIITALSDGRFLVTTQQLVPPHESLVMNHVRRANARQLLENHVGVLEVLHRDGVSPIVGDTGAVAEILRIEHDAWSQLGPFLGPFLAVGTRWQPLVMHTRVASETILRRGLESTRAVPATRSQSSTTPSENHTEVETSTDGEAEPATDQTDPTSEPTGSIEDFPWHEAA